MITVLDTNIILSSISRFSPYRIIMDKFYDEKFILSVSTEILLEYEEKLSSIFSPLTAEVTMGSFMIKNNILFQEIYINWNLLYSDVDDNKFVDCAIASNADYLVTNDKGYNILKNIKFPSLAIITIDEFVEILKLF